MLCYWWAILSVLVSLTNTLAFDTKYRYWDRCAPANNTSIGIGNTNIGINTAEAQLTILLSISVWLRINTNTQHYQIWVYFLASDTSCIIIQVLVNKILWFLWSQFNWVMQHMYFQSYTETKSYETCEVSSTGSCNICNIKVT